MMVLPKDFDQNEWFVMISFFIVIFSILKFSKRFPLSITILVILFASTVGRIADRFLAGPKWDFYDIMDTPKYDFFDFLTYLLYGLFAYIFVYFFERLNIKGYKILVYIIVCSVIGTSYEWLASLFKVFNYKTWKVYFSFNFYLVIQALTILFYRYIKNMYEQHTRRRIFESSSNA